MKDKYLQIESTFNFNNMSLFANQVMDELAYINNTKIQVPMPY